MIVTVIRKGEIFAARTFRVGISVSPAE